MKYKCLFLFLFIPVCLFAEIVYPESLYVIDKKFGYKLMIGTSPEFVENFFGKPKEKILRFKFISPDYEFWDIIYNDFEIRYQTYDHMITSIKINTDAFYTSKNITVGSSLSEVIQGYGDPTYINRTSEGELIYQYEQFIKEINLEGEYTVIQFRILNNKVQEILIDIVSGV
jgi:hypothetical protein